MTKRRYGTKNKLNMNEIVSEIENDSVRGLSKIMRIMILIV